jgi:hypothetical protein
VSAGASGATVAGGRDGSPFLFSPRIDLLVVANVGWPLLLGVDVLGGLEVHESLLFWQVFFVTTPHRWITLAVVALDRQRTAGREAWLAAVAAIAIVVVGGAWLGTGALLCLGVVDHAWNAWHFASQHHGVLRIYQHRAGGILGGGSALVEKVLMRGFLLYVIARVAGLGWQEGAFPGSEFVRRLDPVAAVIPATLVASAWWRWWRGGGAGRRAAPAAAIYMTSVIGLYTALLAAAHAERVRPVVSLALASAVFHAVEYLAIVTWATGVRGGDAGRTASTAAVLRTPLLLLAVFLLVVGAGNYAVSRGFFEAWVAVNLVVAFCHYGFDGIIWRRRPAAVATTDGGVA